MTLSAGTVLNASYEWRVQGSPTIISSDQSPVLYGLTATTTYELTIISNGCISDPVATTTVTVNDLPVAAPTYSYSLNTDCSPSNLSLDAVASSGTAPYTYQWTGSNGFTSTAAAPTIADASFVNNGSYTVQVTDANGCMTIGSVEVSGILNSQAAVSYTHLTLPTILLV